MPLLQSKITCVSDHGPIVSAQVEWGVVDLSMMLLRGIIQPSPELGVSTNTTRKDEPIKACLFHGSLTLDPDGIDNRFLEGKCDICLFL